MRLASIAVLAVAQPAYNRPAPFIPGLRPPHGPNGGVADSLRRVPRRRSGRRGTGAPDDSAPGRGRPASAFAEKADEICSG
jgi:hypothetical protein